MHTQAHTFTGTHTPTILPTHILHTGDWLRRHLTRCSSHLVLFCFVFAVLGIGFVSGLTWLKHNTCLSSAPLIEDNNNSNNNQNYSILFYLQCRYTIDKQTKSPINKRIKKVNKENSIHLQQGNLLSLSIRITLGRHRKTHTHTHTIYIYICIYVRVYNPSMCIF